MQHQSPLLSIVIPTLNEGAAIGALLSKLASLDVAHEVIVVDGGSMDATADHAAAAGGRVIAAPPGRGGQLKLGAASARAPLLCFLHADVRLGSPALTRLAQLALSPPPAAFAFRLRIDAPGRVYRVIEAGSNFRSRCLGLPFGDQGLLVRRVDYDAAGGYPAHPLMEDVALVRRLRSVVPVRLLDEEIGVSPRRWQRDGPVRRTLRNQWLLLRYWAGVRPERLARGYRAEEPAG